MVFTFFPLSHSSESLRLVNQTLEVSSECTSHAVKLNQESYSEMYASCIGLDFLIM
jgi:hypothetical protein